MLVTELQRKRPNHAMQLTALACHTGCCANRQAHPGNRCTLTGSEGLPRVPSLPSALMKLQQPVLFLSTILLLRLTAFSQESPPTLPLSKAAAIAEEAVAAGKLPSDRFVRSILLLQKRDGSWFYRVSYKPRITQRMLEAGSDEKPPVEDVIHVSMDGKVTFEQEEITRFRPATK
jgi:hypothetical protein